MDNSVDSYRAADLTELKIRRRRVSQQVAIPLKVFLNCLIEMFQKLNSIRKAILMKWRFLEEKGSLFQLLDSFCGTQSYLKRTIQLLLDTLRVSILKYLLDY